MRSTSYLYTLHGYLVHMFSVYNKKGHFVQKSSFFFFRNAVAHFLSFGHFLLGSACASDAVVFCRHIHQSRRSVAAFHGSLVLRLFAPNSARRRRQSGVVQPRRTVRHLLHDVSHARSLLGRFSFFVIVLLQRSTGTAPTRLAASRQRHFCRAGNNQWPRVRCVAGNGRLEKFLVAGARRHAVSHR